MKFSIIVALCSDTNCIGSEGTLPCKSIKGDMDFFVKTTKGEGNNAIIMGRKTWESLKSKPLPDRLNIVVSSTLKQTDGMLVYPTLYKAIDYLENQPIDEVYIIGGGQLYECALFHPYLEKLYVTSVEGVLTNCDTFFPELGDEFSLVFESETVKDTKSGLRYTFKTYERTIKCLICCKSDNNSLYCSQCIKHINFCQTCKDEIDMTSQMCSRCVRK